MITRTCLCVAL